MSIRLAGRGHATFDVYDGPTFIGSVWHYHDGWAAFTRGLQLHSGVLYATAEQAAAALR